MKISKIVASVCLAFTLSIVAKAETVTSFTTSITASDKSELGRASRSGTPQDWSGTETYTGQTGLANTYYYKTFTFAASLFAGGGFLDITTFDPGNTSNYFISAFYGTYDANNRGANWLGDAGFSGNYQTNDGGNFQVVLPTGMDLVLLVNSTLGGTNGLGTPFYIQVDNYSDNAYTEPLAVAATPEPSSLLLAGTGVLTVIGGIRRRSQAA